VFHLMDRRNTKHNSMCKCCYYCKKSLAATATFKKLYSTLFCGWFFLKDLVQFMDMDGRTSGLVMESRAFQNEIISLEAWLYS